MKKFISVILSILFFIGLFGTLLLGVLRKNISGSTITNLAVELMKPVSIKNPDNGLFYPDEGKLIKTVQYSYDDFDISGIDFSNLDINSIISEYCEASGVDVEPEFIAEVLSDSKTSKFIDKYITEITEYVTGVKDELDINPEDVEMVVNNAIKTGEKVDRSGLNENISAAVKESSSSITAAIDEVKEQNKESLEQAKIIVQLLSIKTFLICIACCVVLSLLILLINKNIFCWFKYISIPAIAAGGILFIASLLFNGFFPSIEKIIFEQAAFEMSLSFVKACESIVFKIIKCMKINGIVSVLIGVILCVFGFKLDKKSK